MPDLPPPPTTVETVIVRAARLPPSASLDAFSVIKIDEADLAGRTRIDQVLSQAPGASLFRRSDSLAANPTTQGLSLRAIAPSGAGRALVTLDGVPQNDPFGGWVIWASLPPEILAQASVTNVNVTTERLGAGERMQGFATEKVRMTVTYSLAIMGQAMNTMTTAEMWVAKLPAAVATSFLTFVTIVPREYAASERKTAPTAGFDSPASGGATKRTISDNNRSNVFLSFKSNPRRVSISATAFVSGLASFSRRLDH